MPRPLLVTTALVVFALAAGVLPAPAADRAELPPAAARVHAFYYGWYATEEVDGFQAHWNHEIIGDPDGRAFPGGQDIGADYYPALGPYSSSDPAVLARHMRQLRAAGCGVLVASWWGPDTFEDGVLASLLDAAVAAELEIAVHLEPFAGRDAATSREALRYLLRAHGDHPALHRPDRWGGRPVVYVYDSYLTPAADWARLLQPDGEITIRGTELDCVMIGLWVEQDEGDFFLQGGFDGFYTYFAADGFTWASSREHWPALAGFAAVHGLIFVPCVGPGYCDTRIRPWNESTTRDREAGAYYDRQFQAALLVRPHLIGITSFNEWHEGTQIEPAVPLAIDRYTYRDYRPHDPEYYLRRTRYWVERWRPGER